jgi:flagellar basal-body rod modification protein FlgD
MTTVNPVSSNVQQPAGISSLTSSGDQQDRFMKLLVAQMKNQDPLNPMDNAQMTSQIAQINTVGGIEKLNRTVESLLAAFGAMQSQGALQLAGRDVMVKGDELALADGHARGGVEFGSSAASVSIEVLAADGSVVRTLPLGKVEPGVRTFEWDGRDGNGLPVEDGNYKFRVAPGAKGAKLDATPLAPAHVNAISPNGGKPVLDLGTRGNVPLADVRSYL